MHCDFLFSVFAAKTKAMKCAFTGIRQYTRNPPNFSCGFCPSKKILNVFAELSIEKKIIRILSFVLTMLFPSHNCIVFSFDKSFIFSKVWFIASVFRSDASNDFLKSCVCSCPLSSSTSFWVKTHQRLKWFLLLILKIQNFAKK